MEYQLGRDIWQLGRLQIPYEQNDLPTKVMHPDLGSEGFTKKYAMCAHAYYEMMD